MAIDTLVSPFSTYKYHLSAWGILGRSA